MYLVSDSDSDLIAALQSGDETAFRILYERYWSEVYTMIFRRIKDEEAAKDIVQNIFVNLWSSRKKILVENSLGPYLNVAVRNRSISYYKKNLAVFERDTEYQAGNSIALSPDHDLEARELQEVIDEEIARMPDNMRRAFLLSRHEKLSIREIAIALSLSEQTIKNNISEALSRLRKTTNNFYANPTTLASLAVILLMKT